MINSLIEQRLKTFKFKNDREEENALKECFQECILLALSRSRLFVRAAFHGGTALRVLHGLDRFSEGIDLALLEPDPDFQWEPFRRAIEKVMLDVGVDVEVKEKTEIHPGVVKKMVIKGDSLAKFLVLRPIHHKGKRLVVKVEIDTNPPSGATTEIHAINFPETFAVSAHDLESLFAGKVHALLCRPYVKGRDWYDFLWYCRMGIKPNFRFLEAALLKAGPWKHLVPAVDATWFEQAMIEKIDSLEWSKVAQDVASFLREDKREALELWGAPFFRSQLARLVRDWG